MKSYNPHERGLLLGVSGTQGSGINTVINHLNRDHQFMVLGSCQTDEIDYWRVRPEEYIGGVVLKVTNLDEAKIIKKEGGLVFIDAPKDKRIKNITKARGNLIYCLSENTDLLDQIKPRANYLVWNEMDGLEKFFNDFDQRIGIYDQWQVSV